MPGPLFIDCGKPIPRNIFIEQLWWTVKSCGLDSQYKGHIFVLVLPGLIMLQTGDQLSDSQICTLVQWQSNAFTKYVRIPSLSIYNLVALH